MIKFKPYFHKVTILCLEAFACMLLTRSGAFQGKLSMTFQRAFHRQIINKAIAQIIIQSFRSVIFTNAPAFRLFWQKPLGPLSPRAAEFNFKM